MAQPIRKGEIYGDFTPIGRKKTRSGFKFRCQCVKCDLVKTYAESTLRAKPECVRCKRQRNTQRMESGELPEGINENLVSFRHDSPAIQEMLEALEDAPGTAFQKQTIRTLIDLIPEAEMAYRERPSQGQAYALNSFITNVRELIQDLDDKAAQGNIIGDIMDNIMKPRFREIARMVADSHYSMKRNILPYVNKKRRGRTERDMDDITRDLGSKLEAVLGDIEKGLTGRIK